MDASGIFARFLDRAEEGIKPARASARDCGDAQGAVLHAASRQDAIAGAFDHRVGLAGQGSLGNQGDSVGDRAVNRHTFPGADQHLVAGRDAVDGDTFPVAVGVDPLAKIEGRADFFDRAAEGIAALAREDRAEGVDGDQDGDNFVVDPAGAGDRAVDRGEESTDDAEEEKLLENNPSAPERGPRLAKNGQTGEEEHTEGRKGEGPVDHPAGVALDRRHVDREAENHGLGGEESGHTEAQPGFGLAIKDKFLAFAPGGRALAAGGHGNLS